MNKNMAGAKFECYAESDKRFINKNTISSFARTNETFLDGKPVKAILLEFPGLGGSSCLGGLVDMGVYDTPFGKKCATLGIVIAYMYCGPWSWMNKGAVRMTDLVVDALIEKYSLNKDCPLIVSGGSMGGLGSLIYSADSRHNVTACLSACPCLDAIDRLSAAADISRTFISAVSAYDCSLTEALESISPIHRINNLPHIPYHIICDMADELFDYHKTDAYVKILKDKGLDVTYVRLEGKKHGEFTPESRENLEAFILENAFIK